MQSEEAFSHFRATWKQDARRCVPLHLSEHEDDEQKEIQVPKSSRVPCLQQGKDSSLCSTVERQFNGAVRAKIAEREMVFPYANDLASHSTATHSLAQHFLSSGTSYPLLCSGDLGLS